MKDRQSRDREGSNAHRRATEAARLQHPAEMLRQASERTMHNVYVKKITVVPAHTQKQVHASHELTTQSQTTVRRPSLWFLFAPKWKKMIERISVPFGRS